MSKHNGLEYEQDTAISVLKEYTISILNITLIQGGTIKTVWKIKTNNNELCLKRLKQSYDKALFSVNAQIHIKNSGGNVPGIVLNRNNSPITIYNEQLFVLYEWVDGNDLDFGNPSDLKAAVQGLAEFHIHSKGYHPDSNSRISSKLGKWPEQYASMLERLASWMKIAAVKSKQPHYASYLKNAPSMISLGESALDYLAASKYRTLTEEGSSSIVLCHQDYGRGNAIQTINGICVLDLDGVTFDLPARDLRKIIGKNAENRSQWNSGTITDILNWYYKINPAGNFERQIVYIDMLFPHWFYGLVKNLFQGEKAIKALQIEKIASLEESKVSILNPFLLLHLKE